ncbi:MAG: 4-(cytidine 5'-diphospho)-2-C-methyl-D-erythritol kinase, partial [Bacteroidia bacterium]
MIFNANAKINLGLHVIEKRADGYHNIETVFYPIGW